MNSQCPDGYCMEYGGSYLCVCHTDHNISHCERAGEPPRNRGAGVGRKARGLPWAPEDLQQVSSPQPSVTWTGLGPPSLQQAGRGKDT